MHDFNLHRVRGIWWNNKYRSPLCHHHRSLTCLNASQNIHNMSSPQDKLCKHKEAPFSDFILGLSGINHEGNFHMNLVHVWHSYHLKDGLIANSFYVGKYLTVLYSSSNVTEICIKFVFLILLCVSSFPFNRGSFCICLVITTNWYAVIQALATKGRIFCAKSLITIVGGWKDWLRWPRRRKPL